MIARFGHVNILHIAKFEGSPFQGVSVAVPQHVRYQARLANVALVNVAESGARSHDGRCLHLGKGQPITELPHPFDHPDLVVFHEVYKPEFLKLGRQLESAGIPYVIVPHGCLTAGAQHIKPLKKALGNALLFNRFIGNAEALQFLSEAEMSASARFGKPGFIGTNGVRVPETCKESFRETGLKIVYVGRLDVHIKGLDLMVEAVSKCASVMRAAGATLSMFGPKDSDGFQMIAKMIDDLAIGDIVHLYHEVIGVEKEQVLLDADAFIQTSRSEGMPLGVLEALAYGLPCLLTKGTTLGDVAVERGFGWVAECSAEGISDAMVAMLGDAENLLSMSVNARAFVSEEMTWEKVSEQAVSHYEEIFGRASS